MVNDFDNSIIFYDNRFLSDIRFVDLLSEIQSKREEYISKYGVDHFATLDDNVQANVQSKEKQEEKGPILKLK